jgi:nucleoside permease NupC
MKSSSHAEPCLATHALCGFASFSRIAFQIGGISVRAQIGLKAMVGRSPCNRKVNPAL